MITNVKELMDLYKVNSQKELALYWDEISESNVLSESLIEDFRDVLDWETISITQKLSESFIERNIKLLYIDLIFKHQTLSENFIRKHAKTNEDWQAVALHQNISQSFANECLSKTNLDTYNKFNKYKK